MEFDKSEHIRRRQEAYTPSHSHLHTHLHTHIVFMGGGGTVIAEACQARGLWNIHPALCFGKICLR